MEYFEEIQEQVILIGVQQNRTMTMWKNPWMNWRSLRILQAL